MGLRMDSDCISLLERSGRLWRKQISGSTC